jgi:hypothetical protein
MFYYSISITNICFNSGIFFSSENNDYSFYYKQQKTVVIKLK